MQRPDNPDAERQRRQMNYDRIIDFEREQVFEGYDPICDESPMYDAEFHGFAYPLQYDDQNCTCTVDPSEPATATLCDHCLYRLTAEAA